MTLHNILSKVIACGIVALGLTTPVAAQDAGRVVTACSTRTYTVGTNQPITLDPNGDMCVEAVVTPAGTQDVNLVGINGGAPVTGSGTATGALRVELPTNGTGIISDITNPIDASQSGTWTVQPGNTQNTTAWLVTNTPSAIAGASLTPDSTIAAGTNNVICATACNLYAAYVTSTPTVSGYGMIFNSTSLPANGAVTPLFCQPIPANSTWSFEPPIPIRFSTGVTIGFSSDADGCLDLTAANASLINGEAM